jgi:hypothetical protein
MHWRSVTRLCGGYKICSFRQSVWGGRRGATTVGAERENLEPLDCRKRPFAKNVFFQGDVTPPSRCRADDKVNTQDEISTPSDNCFPIFS